MTTTNIKSIKPAGGGDFTTLQDWINARAGNLVADDRIEIGEVYSGGDAGFCTSPGSTTDAAHYVEIRAAAGHEHNGVWDTSKAYATNPTGTTVSFAGEFLKLTKMQFSGSANGGIVIWGGPGLPQLTIDRCIVTSTAPDISSPIQIQGSTVPADQTNALIMNSVIIAEAATSVVIGIAVWNFSSTLVYNCTVVAAGSPSLGALAIINTLAGGSGDASTTLVTSENNYLTGDACYFNDGTGTYTFGNNDATSDGEAITPALQNIPYSTATFLNVTPGSENLRLAVGSPLKNAGTDLSGSGVTTDIIGTPRPQGPAFDIGAFEQQDVPICWNYTARYKNSNKLFKASGCGSFPKSLRVPGNVDLSTGRMVDDGVVINPDEYRIV